MDEQIFVGLAFVLSAVPAIVIGLRYRSGRNLETIAGYRADRVGDPQAFGHFMGFWMLAIAALMVAMGVGIMLVSDAYAQWLGLAMVVALQVPILRRLLGASKFQRK